MEVYETRDWIKRESVKFTRRAQGTVYQYQQVPRDEEMAPMIPRCGDKCVFTNDEQCDFTISPIKYYQSPVALLGTMLCTVLSNHRAGLLCIILSFCGCVLTDYVRMQAVDTSFFKGTGLLLAVLLSLRAKNAVSRRQKLIGAVLRMLASARNVLDLVSDRPEFRKQLLHIMSYAFAEVAIWFGRNSDHTVTGVETALSWYEEELSKIPEAQRAIFLRLGGMHELGLPPRPLLLHLRQACDDMFNPDDQVAANCDRISVIRRWHRNIDSELMNIVEQFDTLCIYEEEVHTRQFRWMVNMLISIYVAFYPWCAKHESRIVLGSTTVAMALVFYGLNAITQELEYPLRTHGQGFNLMLTFQRAFKNMQREHEIRLRCGNFLDQRLSSSSTAADAPVASPAALMALRAEFIEAESAIPMDRLRTA